MICDLSVPRVCLFTVLLLVSLPRPSWPFAVVETLSQPATATLSGTVVDQTDAAVSAATVTVTNAATSLSRTAESTSEGTFVFPGLPAGQYTLRVQREGFSPAEMSNVAIDAQDVALRIQLKVESVGETVVVTAQKREERPQDVPVPVTVLNTTNLTSTNQVLLRDYCNSVPGLNLVVNYGFTHNLSIRGVTTGGFSNPTVGVIIDDVPFGSPINNSGGQQIPDVDPGDLAQIEVLRGPQGVLYGANNMGGLIKYVTKDPSVEGFSGSIETGASRVHNGGDSGYNLRASANVPLSDTAAIRVSGYTRHDPGYVANPVLGLDGVNDAESRSVRLSALWQPSARFSIKLSGLYQRTEANGVSDVHPPTDGFPRTFGLGDLEQNNMPGVGGSDRKIWAYNATIKANIGVGDLTTITGYNTNETLNTFDRSDNFGQFAARDFGVDGVMIFDSYDVRRVTQEVRLSKPLGRFDWMVGGFISDLDANGQQNFMAADRTTGAIAGLEWHRHNPITVREQAVFANLGIRLTSRFDIQIGGRHSWTQEHDGEYTQRGPYAGPTPVIAPPLDSEAGTFTYLATARYKVAPELMIYGRSASGYRPGGPNFAADGAPLQYAPDKTQNYEGGVKGDFLHGAISVDASVYYIDWRDLQIQLRTPLLLTYQTNGSRARSTGTEVSATARPLSGLSITGWAAYCDAVLTEPLPIIGSASAYGNAGDRLPNSPRMSGQVSLDQDVPLWNAATGFVGGVVTYTGERISLFTATPLRQIYPAYTRTDLRLGVKGSTWAAKLFVNNVTDERGLIGGGISYQPAYALVYIQPRTVGISLSRTF